MPRGAGWVYAPREAAHPGHHRVDRREMRLALGAAVDACSAKIPTVAHAHGGGRVVRGGQ